jgi:hypothetical protein
MNIFVLDENPAVCAEYHCDKHVVKMVLETAQLLSNVAPGALYMYKQTHLNHPCSKWARESYGNFVWLYELGIALASEYTFRYGKEHKSLEVIRLAKTLVQVGDFNTQIRTPFAQAMPDQYRNYEDAVEAYRNYYRGEKKVFAKYTKRSIPSWL